MHKGCPDAGVPQGQGQGLPGPLFQRCILRTPRTMAVGGAGLVQHKGHSEGGAEQLSPGSLFLASSTLFPISSAPLPRALSPPILSLFSQPQEEDSIVEVRQIVQPEERLLDLGPEMWTQILALLLKLLWPGQVTWSPVGIYFINCILGAYYLSYGVVVSFK